MESFIASSGGFLYVIAAFVVALSIIVAVHEYGHYIVGRWTGIHAEVFSLGFGPVLYARTDRRGTVWQVAALPFGGYVKFLGDANAAGVGSQSVPEFDTRRTMLGAPLWARAATVAAGPIFNFVLSILIFGAIVLGQGETREPLTVGKVVELPNEVQGLHPGDVVQSIDGRPVPPFEEFGNFIDELRVTPTLDYRVERDGQELTVRGPYPYPPRATSVSPQSSAFDVAIRQGDVITAIDGAPVYAFDQLKDSVAAAEGRVVVVDVWRPDGDGGEELQFALAPREVDVPLPEGGFETRYLIGITGGLFFEPERAAIGPTAAAAFAVGQTWRIVTSSIDGLWYMVTGAISSCNLSGPIGIAQTSGAMASQGVSSFIWFVAVLSTAVGLLNLFPIPVLDGGHLVFHAWEAVTGRPPSDGALRILMSAGLALLGSLMVFALTNDLFCP